MREMAAIEALKSEKADKEVCSYDSSVRDVHLLIDWPVA